MPDHYYNLPIELQSKIEVLRPPHKLAEVLKTGWGGYVTTIILKYATGNHDNDIFTTIKAYSFRDMYAIPTEFTQRIEHTLSKLYQHNFEITEERMKRINYSIYIKDYHEFYGNFTIDELACIGW